MPVAGIRRVVSTSVALGLLGVTLALLLYTEPIAVRCWFAVAVTAAIACCITLLSRRLLFSSVVTFSLVAAMCLASMAKKTLLNMLLHSYDLFFYSNLATLQFLWSDYRSYLAAPLAVLAIGLVVAALAWRLDPMRIPRAAAAAVLLLCVAAAGMLEARATSEAGGFRMFSQESSYASAFYLSWRETWRTLARGQLLEAEARTALPDFASAFTCAPTAKPPHIVLIHQESLVPPSLFRDLNYDHSLDKFFLSGDDRLHRLRVETWGGGSWLTEFALLSGVSTKAFGDMRSFVQVLMEGRLKDTLPQSLANCGYRTLMLFPMNNGFVSLDRFYRSIGFSEILDRAAQAAPTTRERDRFYFQNMLNAMDQQFNSSTRPLFVYVQTMASHGPYDKVFMPEEKVPGGGPGTSAELSEFLRRTAMAQRDNEFLMEEIKRRFPDQPILVVRYGDHQPTATYNLINKSWGDDSPDIGANGAPGPFVTFYAMAGHNFLVPPLPDYDPLDVAYLGTVMLETAGLPLSEAQRERKRLMTACHGRYFGCDPRSNILAFHRRLINSGLVRTP